MVFAVVSAQAQTPQINSVQFSGGPGNYTLTIQGTGFGTSTVGAVRVVLPRPLHHHGGRAGNDEALQGSLPFTGDVSNFRIGDGAQVGHGEWGYTGDANVLTYQSWTSTKVVVAGFGGQPGDALTIALWNAASQRGCTWGGNVPGTSAPQISSVELSGNGANLQIVVHGSGFGSAPPTMPPPGTAGDLNYFNFIDFRSHCGPSSSLFGAGFDGWGINPPDSVTLFYQSWSDDEIVISGFGGAYGQGCASSQAGDPITIVVYNSADMDDTGPQTAWGGPAAASIAISVQDLTTGKPIKNGSTITAGDQFQVTVTSAPEYNCAGQFVVTALGAPGRRQRYLFRPCHLLSAPPRGGNSATGGVLSSNGIPGHENDWKVGASCKRSSHQLFRHIHVRIPLGGAVMSGGVSPWRPTVKHRKPRELGAGRLGDKLGTLAWRATGGVEADGKRTRNSKGGSYASHWGSSIHSQAANR
jgi:hypothetical protein